MNTKFTKGPWLQSGATIYALHYARGCMRNKWSLRVEQDRDCSDEEIAANAALIASAPELYEALETLTSEVLLCNDVAHTDWSNLAAAKAALKKARGEA